MEISKDIVAQNLTGEESGTFIYRLHEEQIFDIDAFNAYYDGVCKITVYNCDVTLILSVLKIHNFVLRCIIYHFLPDDLYVIKNLPSDIGDYVLKIDAVNDRLMQLITVD